MARQRHRQVTPSAARIVAMGFLATAIAMGLNYGWHWLVTNTFAQTLLVPATPGSVDLVNLSSNRVLVATFAGGLIATSGAYLLGRLVIAPRIWVLILGLAILVFSLIGLKNIVGISWSAKFSLGLFHVLAAAVLIGCLYWSTSISESDVRRADLHFHELLDGISVAEPGLDEGEQAQIDTAMNLAPLGMGDLQNLNETMVLPLSNNTDTVLAFDPLSMMGLPEESAINQLKAAGYLVHIAARDGQVFADPSAAAANRARISIAGEVVTRVEIG